MLSELWSDVRYRCRALFRRTAMERELDDELRFHLERETEKHVRAGLPRAEAERRARLEFGGIDRAKEESRDARGVSLLEIVAQDLRYGARGLRANPGFTAAVIVTLALGIGVNAAMFSVIDGLMFRPPAYVRAPDDLFRVYLTSTEDGTTITKAGAEYARYQDFARWSGSLATIAGVAREWLVIGSADAARELSVGEVSASFWSLFDTRPEVGRFFAPDEDRVPAGAPVVVVSHAYWKSDLGGRSDVVGSQLQVGTVRRTIIGVAPEGFAGLDAGQPEAMWIPVTSAAASRPFGDTYYRNYDFSWLSVVVRRKPGVSTKELTTDLTNAYVRSWNAERAMVPRVPPVDVGRPRAEPAPLQLERGPDATAEGRVARWVTGVAAIVLLIACANVANLLLARGLRRRREFALRLALGVSHARLFSQLLTESLLLAALGGTAGLAVAQWGGSLLRARFLPDALPLDLWRDTRTLLVAGATTLLVGVLTGIAPALWARLRGTRSGDGELASALKVGGREGTYRRSRARTLLVVMQGTFSVVLLVGAGLFLRSFHNARTLRLGYDPERVMIAEWIPPLSTEQRRSLSDVLVEQVRAVPGVQHATFALAIPFHTAYAQPFFVAGIDSVRKLGEFDYQLAGAEYLSAMGTRILRGRGFTAADERENGPHVVVVSESMARRLWPGREALGQCIRFGADTMPCTTVVGIAEDIRHSSLTSEGLDYYYYQPSTPAHHAGSTLFIRTRGMAAPQVETVRRRLQSLMPGNAYVKVTPMTQIVNREMRSWELGASLFLVFGVLALAVAGVGVYSVIAYDVAQRTQELGVRMALGATAADVSRLILGAGVRFAIPGILGGLALALSFGRFAKPLLFGVSPGDPLVLGGVTVVLLVVSLAASLVPARRAARVDPAGAMRGD